VRGSALRGGGYRRDRVEKVHGGERLDCEIPLQSVVFLHAVLDKEGVSHDVVHKVVQHPQEVHPCGSGFRVQGLGFRVQGAGYRVQGAGCKLQGLRFRVQGSEFRVEG